MIFKNITVVIAIIFLMFSNGSFAQDSFKSEDELKSKAAELFDQKKFVEAAPLYAQLLSLYPKDPEYNYKYGATLLDADPDKSKALKYLAFATSKSNIDPLAYYYAGKAFHYNYQFTKALQNYNKFKTKASTADRKLYEIDQQIEMVKSGNELLRSINRLDVISKESISKDDFFRIYQLEGLDGNVVVKPDEFKSKYDKKNNESSVMYLPNDANEVYFSSYGKNGENQRDIYKAVKLGNGKWSEAVNVGNSINTPYDEAFAFILPDKRTMYFASKGHNSMGGYDLFKTTYDESIGGWTKPVNLDFPFSTVNDDVMFVTNGDQSLAYFASDRNNVSDQYYVYKVSTTPKQPDLLVIKGKFIAENIPTLKRAKITIVDAVTNETVGVYDTDEKGNYSVEIESKGGIYKFNIETTEDAPIHAGTVNIPSQEEFLLLGQELRLVGEGNNQKLVIKNIFDGSISTEDYSGGPIVSSSLLIRQADIKKNADEAQIIADARNTSAIEGGIVAPNDATSTSKTEEVRSGEVASTIAEDAVEVKAKSIRDEISTIESKLKTKADDAAKSAKYTYSEGYKKSNEALEFFKESEKQDEIASSSSGEEQAIALKKAAEAKSRAEKLALESKLALNYAEVFENKALDYSSQLDKTVATKKAVDSLIVENQIESADSKLIALKKTIVIPNNGLTVVEEEKERITRNKIAVENDLSKNENSIKLLSEQIKVIEDEAMQLTDQFENTRNKNEKEKIQNRLNSLSLDKEDLKFEINKNKQEVIENKAEVDQVRFEESYTDRLASGIQNNEGKSLVAVSSQQKEALSETVSYFEENNLLYSTSSSTNTASSADIKDPSVLTTELNALPSDESFSKRISEAQNVTNEAEKNLQLAEINQDWANVLQQKIDLNQQLTSSAEPNQKNSISQEINELKQQKLEKQNAAEEYSKLSQGIGKSSVVSTEPKELSEPSYFKGYEINLKEAEAISDERSRDEAKIAIYNDWNQEIDKEILSITNLSDDSPNAELNEQHLASLREKRRDNDSKILKLGGETTLAENTSANIPQVGDSPNLFNPNNRNEGSSNEKVDPSKIDNEVVAEANIPSIEKEESLVESNDQPKRTQGGDNSNSTNTSSVTSKKQSATSTVNYAAPKGSAADKFSDLKYATDVSYDSPAAKQLIQTAESEKAEASSLMNQYRETRQAALALPTVKERADVLAQADALREQSEKKQIEVNEIYGQVNQAEFIQQNAALNDFPKFSQQFQSSNIELADLLLNESYYYFNEAQNIRKAVVEKERFNQKTVDLQKAYNYEVIALKKQQEAMAALQEATIEYENPSSAEPKDVRVVNNAEVKNRRMEATGQKNVLAAREKAIADSIQGEVLELDSKIAELQYQLSETKKKKEREVIEAEIIQLTEDKERKENQAELYNRRANQLEEQLTKMEESREDRLQAIFEEKQIANQLRGSVALNQPGVDVGAVEFTEDEYNSIKESPAFITYTKNIQERNQLIKEANVMYEQMEVANNKNDKRLADSLQKMIRVKTYVARQKENAASAALVNVNRVEAMKMRKAGALISGMAQADFVPPAPDFSKANDVLASNSDYTTTNGNEFNEGGSTTVDLGKIEVNKNADNSTQKTPVVNKPVKNNSTVPTQKTAKVNLEVNDKGVFSKVNPSESVYSKDNPIPIDVALPKGIIFKVQVGAFRNPISQDLFKGFAPLMGEKVGNGGITRYTAGLFLEFNSADQAKEEIRALGYSDAFVVAFKDGKRINIAEARNNQSEGQNTASIDDVKEVVNKMTGVSKTGNGLVGSGNSLASSTDNATLPAEFKAADIAVAKDIKNIPGVYFTVQVGVYSKPIKKGEIDVPELAVMVVKDGLYRYSSGVYNDPVSAAIGRDRLRKTVPDAFVIAYNNGKKISTDEALKLMNE
ncbi:hypothetical protein [Acidiluteibacter ferrifornacis]|uniref:Uncharacterized protein n=1 Tax=Acidiluteibacter ferrifornacis TaxID=2692424 RepID=A0A6N9NPE1_9FLAO|nr:hypothetical protein [Acidiluteibacter ferrifornacis]NBG66987.1 hypothetical protein [Acidiluteibacter ferrifornacis]